MLIYLAWVEIALLLFMLFLGPEPTPPLDVFVPILLLTPRGLGLLIVGTGSGWRWGRRSSPFRRSRCRC